MTPTEPQAEYDYRVTERIGIMCGTGEPTEQQRERAEREAREIVRRLKEQQTP